MSCYIAWEQNLRLAEAIVNKLHVAKKRRAIG